MSMPWAEAIYWRRVIKERWSGVSDHYKGLDAPGTFFRVSLVMLLLLLLLQATQSANRLEGTGFRERSS